MPSARTVADLDLVDLARPRSLSDYRAERGMTLPQFTEWLGIAHFEYTAVVHWQRMDPRLRDQIAYRLGVPTNLVGLFDWPTEEDQLPPEGYSAEDRRVIYCDNTAADGEAADERSAVLDDLARVPGIGCLP